ncbi:MAG: ATP-binding cassette domain-containing protein [Thermoleophilia bacterium]|nr:ATP-binding cassette domain-containing protein [Thermoleophilia bacterium]
MNTNIISLKDVTYRYPHAPGELPPAIDGIDLEIGEGEFVGLVGGNGSGKSTLARLLNGLLVPSRGEVRVEGLTTGEHANLNGIRETVGMVFQNPESQIVATSVEDDIAFGMENLGLPAPEIERRIDEMTRRFGLEKIRRSEPHWLSGGQKQRTVLAGVAALRPKVLVLDEPTSMLDARSQRQFRKLVDELWRSGTTIIYITQLMDEIAEAPRLIALESGSVAFDGVPGDFFSGVELLSKTGLEAPLAARLAAGVRDHGYTLPDGILTLTDLVESVCGR